MLMGGQAKIIWRKVAVRAASLVFVIMLAGSVAACAESDDFEFKPRSTGCEVFCN